MKRSASASIPIQAGRLPRATARAVARAFTLVEVVLALGVITFAVLLLLALVPAGLQTNRDTREESMATNIIAAMIADWRAAGAETNASAVFGFPAPAAGSTVSNTLWIDEGGQPAASAAAARYRVAYRVVSPPAGSLAPAYASFTVSWPALATNAAGKVESVAALPQP